MAFVAGKGLRDRSLTAETIAANIDRVLDLDSAEVPSTDDILSSAPSK